MTKLKMFHFPGNIMLLKAVAVPLILVQFVGEHGSNHRDEIAEFVDYGPSELQ